MKHQFHSPTAPFRSANTLAALRARSASLWIALGRAARLLPLLLLLTLPAVVHAQFNYTTDNGTITITRYTGPGGAVTIPSTIDGLPVTSIGFLAFQNNTSLTNVTIPNTVTNIGDYAFFYCTSLTNVTIGNGVTTLGYEAFANCTNLTGVTIPNSVTSIAGGAFGAFRNCTSLTAITVDALNSAYSSVDGVLFDKSQTMLIQYPEGKAGSYTIPNSLTNIGPYAFAYCTSLTRAAIPNSVTSIGDSAFSDCTSLTSVTIGNGVTTLEYYTFGNCTSLTSVTIPDSVTSIVGTSLFPRGAFFSCTSLTNVTIGNSVTLIEAWAFGNCTSLTEVYFQGNAPFVYPDVFEGANKAIVYYLPGTTGWGDTLAFRPTAQWLPEARTSDVDFGVRTNQFGFNIRWASDKVVVVEASPDLSNPVWTPVSTNTLTGGSSYFSDPQWTNHLTRFYRLRSR